MRKTILAALLVTASACPASAQSIVMTTTKEVVSMGQGTEVVVKTMSPFTSVTLADPEVADALPRSDRMLVIVAKKVGLSDLMLFSDGQQMHHLQVHVTATPVAGKVLTHNKKDLSTYTAYQCNPVCARYDDKHENKPPEVIILGAGGAAAAAASNSLNVIIPPPGR